MPVPDVATEPRREVRKDSDEKIIAQLERILSSSVFRQVDSLKRFLTFTVNEALAGRGERLKEFVIAEVFGRGPGFDQRSDPIVRVQARRLRAQLARFYREEGQTYETIIELPKGGYTPFSSPPGALFPGGLRIQRWSAGTPFCSYRSRTIVRKAIRSTSANSYTPVDRRWMQFLSP
jgi:hypothetical protein